MFKLKENAAGRMWSRLYNSEWRTDLTGGSPVVIHSGQVKTHTFSVFHGDLKVTVRGDGVQRQQVVSVSRSNKPSVVTIKI